MIYEKEHRENPFVKKSGAGVQLQHQLCLHPLFLTMQTFSQSKHPSLLF